MPDQYLRFDDDDIPPDAEWLGGEDDKQPEHHGAAWGFVVLALAGLIILGILAPHVPTQNQPQITQHREPVRGPIPQSHQPVPEPERQPIPNSIVTVQPRPPQTPIESQTPKQESPELPLLQTTIEGQAPKQELPAPVEHRSVLRIKMRERTYNIDVRTYANDPRSVALFSDLPRELRFAHATSEIRLFESPNGTLLWTVPQETRFLMSNEVFGEPNWRWIVTLDGQHQGYICPWK